MLLPDPAPDGEVYVTTGQAAEAMRVTPHTVRRWVRSGYLKPAAPGLYSFTAVAAAEKRSRDAEARTRFRQEAAA
jgi:predicted site-specific integrase-resolvase